MRLGSYVCEIKPGTLMKKIYGEDRISERHRHRYGLNRKYWTLFEEKGLVISSVSTDGNVAESVELESDKHKFFIGVQFHPEFKSRPGNPEISHFQIFTYNSFCVLSINRIRKIKIRFNTFRCSFCLHHYLI